MLFLWKHKCYDNTYFPKEKIDMVWLQKSWHHLLLQNICVSHDFPLFHTETKGVSSPLEFKDRSSYDPQNGLSL